MANYRFLYLYYYQWNKNPIIINFYKLSLFWRIRILHCEENVFYKSDDEAKILTVYHKIANLRVFLVEFSYYIVKLRADITFD